jgi:hypothetical protein
MGTIEIIIAASAAAAAWIAVSLCGAWIRAEASAWYVPLITWLIVRGVASFPEEERLPAQAELLENNAKIKSPSWRLFDAASFYFKSGRASRAFAKQDPVQPINRLRGVVSMLYLLAGSGIMSVVFFLLIDRGQQTRFHMILAAVAGFFTFLVAFIPHSLSFRGKQALKNVVDRQEQAPPD